MRKRRRPSQQELEHHTGIDLAPMLDFVLNLLIFFIISATFIKEFGLSMNRPSPTQTEQKKEAGTILIALRSNGEIWMDQRPVDIRLVRANVERARAAKPEAPVVIIADKEAQNGLLVRVMDQVRQGGVKNVSIAATQ